MIIYLLMMNLAGLLLMFVDKQKARRNKYRISERTLWSVAVVGGALGATLGMHGFRHKTKHVQFLWGLPILAIVQWVILAIYVYQS